MQRAGANGYRTAGRTGLGAGARSGAAALVALLAVGAASCREDGLSQVTSELEVAQALDFGFVPLGRNRGDHVTVRNIGRAPVILGRCVIELPAPDDFVVVDLGKLEISPGGSAELPLSFAPLSLGKRGARLLVTTDASAAPSLTIELRGEGILGRAEASTRSLDFGRIPVRSVALLPLGLANVEGHGADVFLPAPTGDDPAEFHSQPTGALSIKPGATLEVEMSFAPIRLGKHSAKVLLQPCPSCATEEITLVGEGIAAALVTDPPNLSFGFVEPGKSATRVVRVGNLGSRPAKLTAATLGQSTGPAFTIVDFPAGGLEIAPDEWVEITVRFEPTTLETSDGTLRLNTEIGTDKGQLVVPLSGFGGGPDIDIRPPALNFPRTGVQLEVEKRVSIYNAGHDPANTHPLIVTDFFIDGPNGGDFRVEGVNLQPGDPIQAGNGRTLVIRFSPLLPGLATAFLHVLSNDGDEPDVVVPLNATAIELGPCTYTVVPERLDFGAVHEGTTTRLSFSINNTGPNPCAVANVRLARGTPRQYALAPLNSQIIEPGERLIVPVEFSPDVAGAFTGRVEFDVSSPAAPKREVPLLGVGINACLVIDPHKLAFGIVGLRCAPPTRSVAVQNACGFPVDVHQSWVGTGVSDEFSLAAASAGPRTLQPGEQLVLPVTYAPVDEGNDGAPLYLDTSLGTTPLLVGLEGRGTLRPSTTDLFVLPPQLLVDFLFIVDNSGSLMEEQDALSRNFDRFIQAANARGVDYRLAVTTTGLTPYRGGWSDCPGGVDGGEGGRFFPVDNSGPRILTPQTPNLRDVFARNVKVGVCHWWEEGLEAARLALSPPLIDHADLASTALANDGNAGFLRAEAKLYVLYLSDEEDAGTVPVADYIAHLRDLKPGRPDLVSASAIVGLPSCSTAPSVGTRYMQVVNAMGGMVADICSPDWGGVLERIGNDAFTPRLVFPLEQAPDGRELVVEVDGLEVSRLASDGSTQWSFDPTIGDHGAVVFEDGRGPGPGSTVAITYPVPCPEPGAP